MSFGRGWEASIIILWQSGANVGGKFCVCVWEDVWCNSHRQAESFQTILDSKIRKHKFSNDIWNFRGNSMVNSKRFKFISFVVDAKNSARRRDDDTSPFSDRKWICPYQKAILMRNNWHVFILGIEFLIYDLLSAVNKVYVEDVSAQSRKSIHTVCCGFVHLW